MLIVEPQLEFPGPKIVYINKAFTQMTGYSFEDLEDKTPRVLQGKESNRSIGETLKDKMRNGESFSFQTVNYKKDGTKYDVKINIFPIKDSDGNIINYASVQEDISNHVETVNYLQRFIDLQDNMIILTDGTKLNFANKRLFDFFGFENLDDFTSIHQCICERFIEDDRFFNLTKVKEDENWVDVLKTLPHSKRIVTMLGSDFKIHAFAITVNVFDSKMDIVTFSNISQTVLNQINLHKKTIHDKLTGAFNREYFEQNYRNLIDEYQSSGNSFGLALLDIDHFKSVNDTYGHDVGDYVLKHMVELVQKFSRTEDILIRWGGEEFVMILNVKSLDALHKALEHIRQVIELEEFDTVKTITCSFGAAVYKNNEDIEETIKRADDALYFSKRTGRNKVTVNQ